MSYYWFLDRGVSDTDRGTGKTQALCEAAKKIGATLIVHSAEEKKRVEELYGVKAAVIRADMRGTEGPYLIDSHAASLEMAYLENEAGRYIDALRKIRKSLSTGGVLKAVTDITAIIHKMIGSENG